MIVLKSRDEIQRMKKPNRLVAEVLQMIEHFIQPGAHTAGLNEIIEAYILDHGAVPSFKGYHGYPFASCISINEAVVHGIPDPQKRLQEGDIVSIDVGVYLDGFHGDAARTFAVGKISDEAQHLVSVTRDALEAGLKAIEKMDRLGDVSYAIQTHVESQGFAVIREYVGHGIGRELHEAPQIPNYGPSGRGIRLRRGMTLAIEPMVSAGDWRTDVLEDGFTAVTMDRSLSAHFEDTVAITDNGLEILTRV